MMLQVIAPIMSLILMTIASAFASSSLRHLSVFRPTCYIENGFDYQGNDIKNVPNTPVDQCCSLCNNVDGCNAWSWSNFNGGTCWLKSARGKITANANVKSSPLYSGAPPACVVGVDVDYVGNDVANAKSPSVDGCCDLCHNTLGCRAYTWTSYNNGTCWLKSSMGQAVVKTGAKSAQAFPNQPYLPTCALVYDVDFVDNDIGSAPSANPTGCCDICSKKLGCAAFSWTNMNGGTCWLKSAKVGTIKKAGVVSAALNPDPQYPCTTEPGVDYLGNDIANIPSVEPDACCSLCFQNANCKAYTWSDYNGGTCWLKSAKTAVIRTGKTLAGVVTK